MGLPNEYKPITAENAGDGALVELFDEAVVKIMEDIDEPNKKSTDKRSVTLKVDFVREESGQLSLTFSSSISLASRKKRRSFALVDGKTVLQHLDKQAELPIDNIEKIGKRQEGGEG